MINKVISVITDDNNANWKTFTKSLVNRGWQPCPLYIPQNEWRGNVDKNHYLSNYLKTSGDEYFIFMDAYDVIVLGTPEEFNEKIKPFTHPLVFSAEKNCWPDASKSDAHPYTEYAWKFLNAGQFFGKSEVLCSLVENMPDSGCDQLWWINTFLENQHLIQLDYFCNVFQSIFMEEQEDFYFRKGRLYNRITNTCPVFIHGNGKQDMKEIYLNELYTDKLFGI